MSADAQNSPTQLQRDLRKERRSYMIGAVVSLVLTLPVFYAAMTGVTGRPLAIGAGLAALLQITVHLHYFLHLRIKGQTREDLHLVVFTLLILILMGGGTVWILFNLSSRM